MVCVVQNIGDGCPIFGGDPARGVSLEEAGDEDVNQELQPIGQFCTENWSLNVPLRRSFGVVPKGKALYQGVICFAMTQNKVNTLGAFPTGIASSSDME